MGITPHVYFGLFHGKVGPARTIKRKTSAPFTQLYNVCLSRLINSDFSLTISNRWPLAQIQHTSNPTPSQLLNIRGANELYLWHPNNRSFQMVWKLGPWSTKPKSVLWHIYLLIRILDRSTSQLNFAALNMKASKNHQVKPTCQPTPCSIHSELGKKPCRPLLQDLLAGALTILLHCLLGSTVVQRSQSTCQQQDASKAGKNNLWHQPYMASANISGTRHRKPTSQTCFQSADVSLTCPNGKNKQAWTRTRVGKLLQTGKVLGLLR